MNIYQKINAIMEAVESLQKDGRVQFGTTKYNYLSEAKTTAEMRKQLVKHKLVILPVKVEETVNGNVTHGKYTYKLINAENPEEFVLLESGGQGHDSADKGSGKASSYAYKYLMWRTFAIPSNDDPDQVSSDEIMANQKDMPKEEKVDPNQKIGPVQAKAIKDLAAATESDVAKMCQHFGAKALDDLTLGQWAEAKKIMEKKKK